MATFMERSAQKLVPIMPVKIMFTGNLRGAWRIAFTGGIKC